MNCDGDDSGGGGGGCDDDDDGNHGTECGLPVLPDQVLLEIFKYLNYKQLLNAGLVCRFWHDISQDNMLWRKLFYEDFKIEPASYATSKHKSWLSEYKRLSYHIPIVQTEVLTEHQHQVLHVSFSHDGKLFATCSKDGYVLVWNSSYPASVKYHHDMKSLSWKYTQYSQFNESDSLLLVSGVHFGTRHSTSGEIAVFNLRDKFELRCRVMNKPYDIFGTWYTDRYLLSGALHWLAHLVSTSLLWLNKASQESDSEHVPITIQLYRFYNTNASSIRAIMVANCLSEGPQDDGPTTEAVPAGGGGDAGGKGGPTCPDQQQTQRPPPVHYDLLDYARPFGYDGEYRTAEVLRRRPSSDDASSTSEEVQSSTDESDASATSDAVNDKYLIFTTGSKTYTPHQIGFKRIKPFAFPKRLDAGPSLRERMVQLEREREAQNTRPEPNWLDYESVADKFDKVDHLIDLHGHIIGMALSPDHRYLYVNSRPWPHGYTIRSPSEPPPIAQEIDMHVIDLVSLREVGTMLRAHKAYTPNNECFFIFLDVCEEYVASGAEDRFGYLWDRRYGVCLAKFPHSDVVNSVAFNRQDSEMLVTTSDDHHIKVWRSRAKVRHHGLDAARLPHAVEVRKARKS